MSSLSDDDITQESMAELNTVAVGKHGVDVYNQLKVLKHCKASEDRGGNHLEHGNYFKCSVDDSQVQKATATVEQSNDEMWLVMGCLTAVTSFARDLKPGESRATLMKRLQVGLTKDDMGFQIGSRRPSLRMLAMRRS